LRVSRQKAEQVVARLEQMGLLTRDAEGGMRATEEGRREALRVVRIHRLWERYLADETGLPPDDWHRRAHELEHLTNDEDLRVLERGLGFPQYDPHGDPIPSEGGSMPPLRGDRVEHARPGDTLVISHLEDEPHARYVELVSHGLAVGMPIRLDRLGQDSVRLESQGRTVQITRDAAQNLWVRPAELRPDQQAILDGRTLASLKVGESAVVRGISPRVRGLQRRRLLDLGFVPGSIVTPEFRSPGGDPTAFRVRGTLIALRRDQAALIFVEPPAETA
ncbi:MAG: metal-dependent transcriptional regulator, partial [Thermogutta sp.]|nr:metal-dependent transcriptional regulator [Thermogutta sp.]